MIHSFDVDVAKKYGVHAAVILQNVGYWVEKNAANNENFFDGDYWTYNSTTAFSEIFPYLTARQIRYALQQLIDGDVIKTGNYNKIPYDRTLWYALTEKGKSILQFRETHLTNLSNENDKIVSPIPYINTDINTDKKPYINRSSDKPVRHKYGEYKNVLLSDDDIEKLQSEFPGDWDNKIENLSAYIASTGKTYKNHLATIRTWARKDKEKETKNGGITNGSSNRNTKDCINYGKIGTWF